MDVSFGKYFKANSLVHKLDPRFKLFACILFIVSIFLNTGFTGFIFLFVGISIFFLLSRLPFSFYFKPIKPMILIFVFLFIFNCFLIHPVEGYGSIGLIWNLGNGKIFSISWKAISLALFISIRILLMVLVTTILTTTTKPLDLTISIEDILSPLKLIKFPVHIISMIISIALRMIPTLLDEAGRIMKAQSSRGIDYKNAKFKEKIKSIVSLIIPLLVSSFQKAEDLSYAMDVRGYNPHAKRTRYRQFKFSFVDIILFLFLISFSIIIFVQASIFFIPLIPEIDKFVLFKNV